MKWIFQLGICYTNIDFLILAYTESRHCVKLYQDECYPIYCNTTATWKMTCPCRDNLCNAVNMDRENEAFSALRKLSAVTTPTPNKRKTIKSNNKIMKRDVNEVMSDDTTPTSVIETTVVIEMESVDKKHSCGSPNHMDIPSPTTVTEIELNKINIDNDEKVKANIVTENLDNDIDCEFDKEIKSETTTDTKTENELLSEEIKPESTNKINEQKQSDDTIENVTKSPETQNDEQVINKIDENTALEIPATLQTITIETKQNLSSLQIENQVSEAQKQVESDKAKIDNEMKPNDPPPPVEALQQNVTPIIEKSTESVTTEPTHMSTILSVESTILPTPKNSGFYIKQNIYLFICIYLRYSLL